MDLNLIKKQWQATEKMDLAEIDRHISNYRKMDELLPHSPQFFILLNLHSMEYNFLGSSQEGLSGFTNDEVLKKGIQFLKNQMHPEDVSYIGKYAFEQFGEVARLESVSQRKNLLLHINYRFQHKNGHWLHLMEHVWIVKLDDEGNPQMTLTHVHQLPTVKPFRGSILIKKLQADNSYITLYSKNYPHPENGPVLGTREKEIMQLIAQGLKGRDIADKLCISYETVRTHRRNILKKLNLKTSGEVVAFAISNGLI